MALKRGSIADLAWRKFATGYCFVFFGLYAVVLSVTLFPVLRLVSADAAEGRVRIQRAMRWVFAFFARMMQIVGVIDYEFRGLEQLPRHVGNRSGKGYLIVANHPSLIDVVLLVSRLPQVDCIVKEGLWRNPFLRWPVAWAGYVPNRSAEELVSICAENLRSGRSLVVFPEGTRTVPERGIAMKRGAAQIALASRADILPVTISCEPLMLAKTQAWHEAPLGPGRFIVSVGEPISADEYAPAGVPHSLAARAITRRLERYFARSLAALREPSAASEKLPPVLPKPCMDSLTDPLADSLADPLAGRSS